MDFAMHQLFDGRRLRALTLLDNDTSECRAIDIGQNFRGDDVVATLGRVCALRGMPRHQNEFRRRVHLQSHGQMAYENGLEISSAGPANRRTMRSANLSRAASVRKA